MPDDRPADPLADAARLTRRAALARAAAALGAALSAGTVAGVLAGCGRDRATPAPAAAPAYRYRVLTPEQERLVSTAAEHILPTTDTPGARDAGVSEFVDRMLADWYPAAERDGFVAGLARLDARAARRHGRPFLGCTGEQQYALLDALDAQAFPVAGGGGAGSLRAGGSENAPGVAAQRDPGDVGPKAFFRTLKELTLVAYYTSEPGATRELRVNPWGRYRADVPYAQIGRAWA